MGKSVQLTSEQKDAYKRLKKALRSNRQWTPVRYWDLGQLWDEVGGLWANEERGQKRVHGLTPKLAKDVKERTTVRNLINTAQNIFRKFPEKEFVEKWQQQGGTVVHFKRVLPVSDKRKRLRLLEQAIKKGWPTSKLAMKVDEQTGKIKKGVAGTKVQPAENIDGALHRLIAENNHWIGWAGYCFDDPGYINKERLANANNDFTRAARKTLAEVERYAKKGLAVLRRQERISSSEETAAPASDVRPGRRQSKTRRQSGSGKRQ